MNRTEVIQRILEAKSNPTYLEIGVKKGENFLPIKAWHKIAIDPHFYISMKDKIRWVYKNPGNIRAKYYEVTSDDYFTSPRNSRKLDLVFIDGLHTYQQSLKDVINSLDALAENGVIIMHDCNPPHAAAAHPTEFKEGVSLLNLPGWTGEWCGDVWKTICYLRSTRNDLEVFVLNCDYGLGIVMKRQAENNLDYSTDAIESMTYEDLSKNRDQILNLKNESYLFELIKSI